MYCTWEKRNGNEAIAVGQLYRRELHPLELTEVGTLFRLIPCCASVSGSEFGDNFMTIDCRAWQICCLSVHSWITETIRPLWIGVSAVHDFVPDASYWIQLVDIFIVVRLFLSNYFRWFCAITSRQPAFASTYIGFMRVLVVNAYPASSKRGRERFEQFRRHVTRVVGELQKSEVTRVEIVVRNETSPCFILEKYRSTNLVYQKTVFDYRRSTAAIWIHSCSNSIQNSPIRTTSQTLISSISYSWMVTQIPVRGPRTCESSHY